MATGKNVIVLFANVPEEVLINSEADQLVKMRRKGSMVHIAAAGDVKVEALAGAPTGQSLADAAKEGGYVVEPIAPASELSIVEDIADEAVLLAEIDKAFALASTKMLLVVVTKTCALFYGLGIERGVIIETPVPAACIAPTLAWIGDLPLPAQVEAAPLYKIIKGLNYKAKEIAKLRDSIAALELKIERDNRKPWDKHDCA
ncbi:MAG: hypothetical protein J5855_08285 [Mailhella sp.]|nr:hypothetical protein [Mailhella sp.]